MICKQFVLAIIRHDSDCCTKGHKSGRKYRTSHTSKHVIKTHFGGAAITCPSRIPSDLHFSTSFPSVIARLITHCLPIVSCFQSHIWGWKMEKPPKIPQHPILPRNSVSALRPRSFLCFHTSQACWAGHRGETSRMKIGASLRRCRHEHWDHVGKITGLIGLIWEPTTHNHVNWTVGWLSYNHVNC